MPLRSSFGAGGGPKIVTIASDGPEQVTNNIGPTAGMPPNTLNQPAFADWRAQPISPGNSLPTPQQARDANWRNGLDQNMLDERRFQQERQRAELKAQIEEKRQRDAARAMEAKLLDEREEAKAAAYNARPDRGGGGAPLIDVDGNMQTNLRQYKASEDSPNPQQHTNNNQQAWPPQPPSFESAPPPPPMPPPQQTWNETLQREQLQQSLPPPVYTPYDDVPPPYNPPPPLPQMSSQPHTPAVGGGDAFARQEAAALAHVGGGVGGGGGAGMAGDAFARQEAAALAAVHNGLLPMGPMGGGNDDDNGESVFGLLGKGPGGGGKGRRQPKFSEPPSSGGGGSMLPTGVPKPVLAVGGAGAPLANVGAAANRRQRAGSAVPVQKPWGAGNKGPWAKNQPQQGRRSTSAPTEEFAPGAAGGRRGGRRGGGAGSEMDNGIMAPSSAQPRRRDNGMGPNMPPPATASSAASANSKASGRSGAGNGRRPNPTQMRQELGQKDDEIKELRRQLEAERATLARRTEQLLEPASPSQRAQVQSEALGQLVQGHFPHGAAAHAPYAQHVPGVMQPPPPPVQVQHGGGGMGVTSNAFGNSVMAGTYHQPPPGMMPPQQQPPPMPPQQGAGIMGMHGPPQPPRPQNDNHQIGGAGVYASLYGGGYNGQQPMQQQQPLPQMQVPPPPPPPPPPVSNVPIGPIGGEFGLFGEGQPEGQKRDPFLSASKACVRADGTRCGRLEAAKMLSLCSRFGIAIPPDMVAAAKKKGMCSYTIFIDRLRQIHGA